MIRQACIFLTRECNLRCQYCKAAGGKKREMGTREVFKALGILKTDLDVELVVLFGGEPMLRKDIEAIVLRCHQLDLPYALITNGTIPLTFVPRNLTVSVDTLTPTSSKDGSDIKSKAGMKRLLEAIELGVKDPVANITITRKNIEEVPDIVHFFAEKGIWSIVGTLHHGTEPFWLYRGDCGSLALEPSDAIRMKTLSQRLLQMKHDGAMIHNVDFYLKHLPDFYLGTWHCSEMRYLSIDTDGSFMLCPDFNTPSFEPFNIFDLFTKYSLSTVEDAWEHEVKDCPGCYYNHEVQTHRGGQLVHNLF